LDTRVLTPATLYSTHSTWTQLYDTLQLILFSAFELPSDGGNQNMRMSRQRTRNLLGDTRTMK
jgi:hypothetical protein